MAIQKLIARNGFITENGAFAPAGSRFPLMPIPPTLTGSDSVLDQILASPVPPPDAPINDAWVDGLLAGVAGTGVPPASSCAFRLLVPWVCIGMFAVVNAAILLPPLAPTLCAGILISVCAGPLPISIRPDRFGRLNVVVPLPP